MGRILIGGGQFLWPALMVLFWWDLVVASLNQWGIEMPRQLAGVIAAFFLVGGALILLGYWCRTAAAAIFVVGLIFGLLRLQFWTLSGFQAEIAQRFLVSFVIVLGGMVILFLDGGRELSLPDKEPTFAYRPVLRSWGVLVARILIGGGFVWRALWDLLDWPGQVELLGAAGFHLPELLVGLSIAAQGICGLSIIVGFGVRWAALLLAALMIVAALVVERFWGATLHYLQETTATSSESFRNDRLLHMKFFADHLGVLGTLFLLISTAPGRYVMRLKRGWR